MNPYNWTHIAENTECTTGLACLLRNINEVGNSMPFMVIFVLTYAISTYTLVKNGNNFIKSFTASTFLMLFITFLALTFGVANPSMLITVIIALAVVSAVNVYLERK